MWLGGKDPYTDEVTGTVTRLNLSASYMWEVRSPMLHPRIDEGSVVFDGRFYVFGGYQNTYNKIDMRVLHSVECYSPSSDEWQLLPPMIQPRMNPRGVVEICGCFYIVDGVDYSGDSDGGHFSFNPEAALEPYAEKYVPSLQKWVALPERLGPRPVDFVSVTACNNCLYLIGGMHCDIENYSSLEQLWIDAAVRLTQRYDVKSNAWELLLPMPQARYWPAAATLNGKIYVFGGENASGSLTTLECFDPLSGEWQILSPMPVALYRGFYVAALGGSMRMHACGTVESNGRFAVSCFDTCTRT